MYKFLAILITLATVVGEYFLIQNGFARLIMIIITICLSYGSYLSAKNVAKKCILGGVKAYDLWKDTDEIVGPIIISIVIDAMIVVLAMIKQFQSSVYWPGVIMSLIAIPIILISSSLLAIKNQIYKKNKSGK